jgi:hypothetical protein
MKMKFSVEQIVSVLKHVEVGVPVVELVARLGSMSRLLIAGSRSIRP